MMPLKIALLCGGPSPERGISLNSARSVMDHLQADDVQVVPIYFDLQRRAYELSPGQLYSNTPSDFDFKLAQEGRLLPEADLIVCLREVDLVFPAMHGAFGEDGEIQAWLAANSIPFVGSPAEACRLAFDKYEAGRFLAAQGYTAWPSLLLEAETLSDSEQAVIVFLDAHQPRRFVVKPARSGSSIGVHVVTDVAEVLTAARTIIEAGIDTRVVVEPFCTGREFTIIVLENHHGRPVALLPTEIGLPDAASPVFDYRKKYLPSRQVIYHTPPRFADKTITAIQQQAETLFTRFGLRDLVRLDGWVLDDGRIWFSDLNIVSGMEQNSFLFLQAAQLGFSHADLLRYVVHNACRRYGVAWPGPLPPPDSDDRQPVHVIFGGDSSERQVSLMSGTNVWLKLLRSKHYAPHPFLLDPQGMVWTLPYALTLRHTVEEVVDACHQALASRDRLTVFRQQVLDRLDPPSGFISQSEFEPQKMSLAEFVAAAPLVFVALHGGMGEDGTFQTQLEAAGVPFTGSSAATARLCMDKYATAQRLQHLAGAGILTAPKRLLAVAELADLDEVDMAALWQELLTQFGGASLIVKPSDDGCSSGVARLHSAADLQTYVQLSLAEVPRLAPGTLSHQAGVLEMPTRCPRYILAEAFIETDLVEIAGSRLEWQTRSGWVEVTVGVLGPAGHVKALSPSLTIAEGHVLSLEEKFQGGTGVNITPPPPAYVSPAAVALVRQRIERAANHLGIAGFARLDAFMHTQSGEIILIEANTIPGLTPSTVIYHQALAETPPLTPTRFLENILAHRWRFDAPSE